MGSTKKLSDESPEESIGDGAYLIWGGHLRRWSWDGYGPPLKFPISGCCKILTPPCIVHCLRAGYRPVHCPFVAGIDEAVRPWQDPPNGRADTPPSDIQTTFKKWPKNALGNITEAVNQQIEKARHEATKEKGSDGGRKNSRNRSDRYIRPTHSRQEPIEQEDKNWTKAAGNYSSFHEDADFANQGKDREVQSYYARPPVKRRWCKKTRDGDTA